MTPRELGGWVPTETHWHYDADGVPIGRTVVERESRIDDADRLDLLGLMQHDAELCNCGFHPSVANDPANTWLAGSRKCPVCAGIAVQWREFAVEDDKVSKDAPPQVARPGDGRTAFMRLLTPEQAAAEQERRSVPKRERD